jgi:hypothetical protein
MNKPNFWSVIHLSELNAFQENFHLWSLTYESGTPFLELICNVCSSAQMCELDPFLELGTL